MPCVSDIRTMSDVTGARRNALHQYLPSAEDGGRRDVLTREQRLAQAGTDHRRRRTVHVAGGLHEGEFGAAGSGDALLPLQEQTGQRRP